MNSIAISSAGRDGNFNLSKEVLRWRSTPTFTLHNATLNDARAPTLYENRMCDEIFHVGRRTYTHQCCQPTR